MANDPRFARALAAAMVASPYTPERRLIDITRAVLHAADEHDADRAAARRHAVPLGAIPARTRVRLVEIVPGDAVWIDDDGGYFEHVDVVQHLGPEVILGYAGGTTATFDTRVRRTILRANSAADADAWNWHRGQLLDDGPTPDVLAEMDEQHPDAGGRRDPGEAA